MKAAPKVAKVEEEIEAEMKKVVAPGVWVVAKERVEVKAEVLVVAREREGSPCTMTEKVEQVAKAKEIQVATM